MNEPVFSLLIGSYTLQFVQQSKLRVFFLVRSHYHTHAIQAPPYNNSEKGVSAASLHSNLSFSKLYNAVLIIFRTSTRTFHTTLAFQSDTA